MIYLKKDRVRSAPEIMDELRDFIPKVEPRLQVKLFQVLPDRLNDLNGEIALVLVKIFGNDIDLMRETAQKTADALSAIPGIVDVYRGFNPGEPELAIHVDEASASRYGLTVQDVNRAAKMALWGEVPTRMLQGLKIVPVRLRYAKTELNHLEKIRSLPIYLPGLNRVVRLEELSGISKRLSEPDLDHENLSQVVNVEANLSGRDLGSVIGDVQHALDNIQLPPGVTLKLAGQHESQQQSFRELLLIITFGTALVFVILLFEFKSFRTAAVILFGTLLAVSGVFLSLLLTGISLDISAFMGMVMIIGVVVNNGILLIDYAEKELMKTAGVRQALLKAGRVRLRPILMTTLSTIVGFLPTALVLGQGAKILQPLAVAMIGGMSVSMLISLLVVPTMYLWVWGDKPDTATRAA